MRVKRYLVESMPEAMNMIRQELGKDAVILNTKSVKVGGFLGMFMKQKIEVVAAMDATSGSEPAKKQLKPNVPYDQPSSAAVSRNKSAELMLKTNTLQHETNVATKEIEPQQSNGVKSTVNNYSAYSNELVDEVKQMKKLVAKLASQSEATATPAVFTWIKDKLLEHEFEEDIVDDIIQDAMDKLNNAEHEISEESAVDFVREQLRQRLLHKPISSLSDESRVIHFVGPTGVGKTTTIAKLAAYQVLKHRKKIGFITADTYRIAAVDQLKTYANILDVPLEVVNSPQDLHKAFERFKDMDMIFMDTAGRNYRNEMYVSELNTLLTTRQPSETFLVLSLTMKYKDMKKIADNFSRFQINKVLFTKMDETESIGPIFNLLNDFSFQLSYITNGQNVPDDISEIDVEQLMDWVLEDQE